MRGTLRELHQHLMHRQAETGRLDAVRRTYQHLVRSLAEINARAGVSTTDLLRQLTAGQP